MEVKFCGGNPLEKLSVSGIQVEEGVSFEWLRMGSYF